MKTIKSGENETGRTIGFAVTQHPDAKQPKIRIINCGHEPVGLVFAAMVPRSARQMAAILLEYATMAEKGEVTTDHAVLEATLDKKLLEIKEHRSQERKSRAGTAEIPTPGESLKPLSGIYARCKRCSGATSSKFAGGHHGFCKTCFAALLAHLKKTGEKIKGVNWDGNE